MKPIAITNEIFQIGGPQLSAVEDAAVFLVNFNGHAAIIDAGTGKGTERILQNMEICNVSADQVEYLALTHCHYDHTGGAPRLKNNLDCKIVAHALDADFLERGDDTVTAASWYNENMEAIAIDWKLDEAVKPIMLGDRIIQAHHIPGHSPGSLAFFTTSEDLKVLFGQDVHGPIHPDLKSNKERYVEALKHLISLAADVLCEGHYGILRGQDEIEGFINKFI